MNGIPETLVILIGISICLNVVIWTIYWNAQDRDSISAALLGIDQRDHEKGLRRISAARFYGFIVTMTLIIVYLCTPFFPSLYGG